MDLPTYTSIWRIEKRLYKLYDFRLPMPVPVGPDRRLRRASPCRTWSSSRCSVFRSATRCSGCMCCRQGCSPGWPPGRCWRVSGCPNWSFPRCGTWASRPPGAGWLRWRRRTRSSSSAGSGAGRQRRSRPRRPHRHPPGGRYQSGPGPRLPPPQPAPPRPGAHPPRRPPLRPPPGRRPRRGRWPGRARPGGRCQPGPPFRRGRRASRGFRWPDSRYRRRRPACRRPSCPGTVAFERPVVDAQAAPAEPVVQPGWGAPAGADAPGGANVPRVPPPRRPHRLRSYSRSHWPSPSRSRSRDPLRAARSGQAGQSGQHPGPRCPGHAAPGHAAPGHRRPRWPGTADQPGLPVPPPPVVPAAQASTVRAG